MYKALSKSRMFFGMRRFWILFFCTNIWPFLFSKGFSHKMIITFWHNLLLLWFLNSGQKNFLLNAKPSIKTWDQYYINPRFWTKYNFQNSLWHRASLFSAKADTTGYHPWDTGCYKNIPVMRQKCKLIRHTVY